MLFNGDREVSGKSVDDYKDVGFYYGSFLDAPVTQSTFGFLIVSKLPNYNYVYQQYIGQKWNGNFEIQGRISSRDTWNAWKVIYS